MLDKTIYDIAPAYYQYYFDLVDSNDILKELQLNDDEVCGIIRSVPEERWHIAYADGKWTSAELIRHVIETERIFSYRALRFSRFDKTALPGFDENDYVGALQSVQFTKDQILREFKSVRMATHTLFESMNADMLQFMGNANGLSMSAEMLGFMIVGHTKHHLQILVDRYL